MQQSYQLPEWEELEMAFLGVGVLGIGDVREGAGGPGGGLLLAVGALAVMGGPGGPGGIFWVRDVGPGGFLGTVSSTTISDVFSKSLGVSLLFWSSKSPSLPLSLSSL